MKHLRPVLASAAVALAAPAYATPVDYIISGASITMGGQPETLSASFIIDPAGRIEYGANIQLSGGAFAGTYTIPSGGFPLPAGNLALGIGPAGALSLRFADNL